MEQLARQFNTSATRLKASFRLAYGTSIRAFVMDQRVRAANAGGAVAVITGLFTGLVAQTATKHLDKLGRWA